MLGQEFDFETDQLIVNGKMISGDVIDWSHKVEDNTITLYCRVAVGWG
jgi:hypothetical protein